MLAIRRSRYGGPETLEIADIDDEPLEAGRVRLRVAASSLNPFEWHHMRGLPWLMRPTSGWRHPRNPGLGVDVAGIVTEVADDVADLRVGDPVFGVARNSLAESATARAEYLVRIPDGVELEAAAAVPLAGLTALQALRNQGLITAGSGVLILGAAGGVGHYAVQIARALGAGRVVASCSGRNASWVQGLGADRVLDYTRGEVDAIDERFDVILDIAGGARIAYLRSLLAPGGSLVLVGGPGDGWLLGPATRIFRGLITSRFRRERVVMVNATWSGEDLATLATMLGEGSLRSIIHREVGLTEVPAAIAELEGGHVPGKIVVRP
ncbi:NAD(P)-dependent alcohol dehydrogenase [Microbacterium schleiferi]|uniref:NAD(P)-dependent alcohol dehydrogenase n=1 Tax=Microbacterium schleiferi TaxID=69362 RepID=A0ABU7V9Y0_9MICO|nr:NAD(P)-dependent alcohol dehydrogenase [Micrococcales bacterium]